MATVTAQSTRRSGASANYAGKDAVAISAVNGPSNPIMFEKRLSEVRAAHGKDSVRPMHVLDEAGKKVRDENGEPELARDDRGQIMYESEYVQAYPVVQSFGLDELDPDDPASWDEAQRRGRALAERIGDGRPALIATEVNGRTGCVHNHIIVGAVHPETGRSLRSDAVTHSRLSITHDRVLEELGVEQREDMRELTRQAEERMTEARQQVIDEAEKDLSPNQLRKRIEAAEKQIRLERTDDAPTPRQKQQDRLQREFERYELNEQTRSAAEDLDAPGPKERFSEIELKGRVRETLADQRATDWQRLDRVGRERGVTITKYTKRSHDVSFGMMLADEDGVIQEPSNAHRRKGSRLGEGYRVEDVEAALERNRELAQAKPVSRPGTGHPQPVGGPAVEHRRAMQRIGEEAQCEAEQMLQQWAKASKPAPTPVETPVVEAPAEPALEESPTQRAERERQELLQSAAEAAEREAKELEEFRARQAEWDRESRQWFDNLMAKAPKEPETPEVETPQVPQAEAEEPRVDAVEAEQPQVGDSKWSKLKERDNERTASEPVEQAVAPMPREPGQEEGLRALKGEDLREREVLAVATELEDGSANVDYQLRHDDPVAKDQRGLHLIAKDGKAVRAKLSAEKYQKLQRLAGDNRTEAEGKQVYALQADLRPRDAGYVPSYDSAKASEHKVGADVLGKQRAAEAREQSPERSREADQQARQRLIAKESSLQKSSGRESRGMER